MWEGTEEARETQTTIGYERMKSGCEGNLKDVDMSNLSSKANRGRSSEWHRGMIDNKRSEKLRLLSIDMSNFNWRKKNNTQIRDKGFWSTRMIYISFCYNREKEKEKGIRPNKRTTY